MVTNRARVLLSEAVGSSSGSNGEYTRHFGVFELDLRAGELRRQGRKVKLQEQPFQVLSQLLENPGDVVTREQLRNRLWPADTFVDFDHSLNAAIRRLRDALGDSAENPRFVETVARRGYRFLAPVSVGPANGSGALQTPPAAPAPFPASIARRWWWILAIVTASVVAITAVLLRIFLAPHESVPPRISQLTANPVGDPVRAAAVSRDGRYLAFSDETGFYLRQIDTGETHALPLPKDQVPASISWFPDSVHMLVALSGEPQPSSLWEVSALGGEARKLVDSGCCAAVSPDGKELAYIAGKALRERVWLASTDGTQPRELAGHDNALFGGLAWSPDGGRLAFTTAEFDYGRGVQAIINVVPVRGALRNATVQPLTVLSRYGLRAPISWRRDGSLLYSESEPRPRELDSNVWSIHLDKQGRPDAAPVRLTNDQGDVFSISVSADGNRLVYVKGVPEPDVYVATLDGSGTLSEPQRLTLDDRQDLPFDWTPDGKQVIFISDRTGTFSIYKQAPGQLLPDMLVGGTQPVAEPRLSPDGTQLLYVVYPNGGDPGYEVPLMRVPLSGGPPQQVAKAKWISNHQCARAPATVCVYSVARDQELAFYTFDPFKGTGSQVFELKDDLSQLYNWSLSPDGSTLAIARSKWGQEEGRIHLVFLNGSPDRWISVSGSPNLASIDWAADSKSLWAATRGEKENELLQIDLRGNARPVWRPKKIKVVWAIPSRDGKKVALLVESTSANIWMLER